MTQHDYMWKLQREKESEARRCIKEWFDNHPDRQQCSAYYTLARGHFINGIEKNEYGIIQLRTDTGGLVDLMHYGADVLQGVTTVIEK